VSQKSCHRQNAEQEQGPSGRTLVDPQNPNSEQQTLIGHVALPGTPYWPHSALASQLEMQTVEPH
jgi:hypothetical protein